MDGYKRYRVTAGTKTGPQNLLSLSFLNGQQALCLLMLAISTKKIKKKERLWA